MSHLHNTNQGPHPTPPHPPLTGIPSLFDRCTLPLPAVHPLTCVHLLMSGSGCGDDDVEVGPVHDGPTAAALRHKAAARSGLPVGWRRVPGGVSGQTLLCLPLCIRQTQSVQERRRVGFALSWCTHIVRFYHKVYIPLCFHQTQYLQETRRTGFAVS